MSISETIRCVLQNEGRTQTWVVKEMNLIDSKIKIDKAKFSAIVCGTRRMTAEELLAFCKATETNPDIFLEGVPTEEAG